MSKAVCPVCGKEFEKLQGNRTKDYCSQKCQKKAWNQKQKDLKKQNPRMIKCAICGKEFHPTHARQKVCTDVHTRPCEVCGKPVPYKRPNEYDRVRTCSEECRRELQRRTNVDRRGVSYPMQSAEVRKNHEAAMLSAHGVTHALQSEEFKEKAKRTNIRKFGSEWALGNANVRELARQTMHDRYGVDYTLQSDELRVKSAQTMQERYGVSSPAHLESAIKKREQTCIVRYGARNPMQCRAIAIKARRNWIKKYGAFWTDAMQRKAEETCMAHYHVRNPSQSKEIIDKIAKTVQSRYGESSPIHVAKFLRKMQDSVRIKYGVPYYVLSDEYVSGSSRIRISAPNRRFADRLTAIGLDVEFEYVIELKSYDLYIPSQKTVIEIDPSYTHGQIANHMRKHPLDKLYHIEKTRLAESNGLRCIHVFDWDDPEMIVDMLADKSIIYARKCRIDTISHEEASAFERENHMQGSCRGQMVCYGLYHQDKLVSVMTFGKPRYNSNYEWELLRLCTLRRYAIAGGAERMFKHFVEDHKPKFIISYCDRSKFSGEVYKRLGFNDVKYSYPNIVWSKGRAKITNNLLLSRGFDQLFKVSSDETLSNKDLMISDGWIPVYDCGQSVFEWRSDTT